MTVPVELDAQYRQLREECGLLDRSGRGGIAVVGPDGAEYLGLADAFDGHQLCDSRSQRVGPAGPSPQTAEWFRRLSFGQGSTRESLHPNAYGQGVIGTCLGLLFTRPRGDYGCSDTPGQWLSGITLSALGSGG